MPVRSQTRTATKFNGMLLKTGRRAEDRYLKTEGPHKLLPWVKERLRSWGEIFELRALDFGLWTLDFGLCPSYFVLRTLYFVLCTSSFDLPRTKTQKYKGQSTKDEVQTTKSKVL